MAHSSTTIEWATGLLPHVVTSGCKPPIIRWIASFARMQSIRQSVQDGQFLCRLAQKASDLSVASHTDKGIERFLVYVVATALAIDQTPTLQLIEPAYDRGAGHAHIIAEIPRLPAGTMTVSDKLTDAVACQRAGSVPVQVEASAAGKIRKRTVFVRRRSRAFQHH